MKNVIVIILFPFLMDGVFAADEIKEVTEGDSLTLPTGLTETQSSGQILWLYGSDQTIIAQIDKGNYSTNVNDERFKGNLELDKQTGSLTIKNNRIKNSGLYVLDIGGGTKSKKFSVTVYASLPTPDIDSPQCAQTPAGSSGPRCVFQCSVQTSDQTTLSWYKGDSVVSSRTSDTFSSLSLNLDYEDKNIYSCMVKNPISNKTKHLDITQLCKPCEAVPDPGLSSGAKAGIVVGFLLVFAAAGVIYYLLKVPKRQNQTLRKISVKERESVTLNPETEIQKDDQIQWTFGGKDILIAEIRGGTGETHDDDGRFRGRLKLDETGSLTITDMRNEHTGDYKLQIISSRGTTNKTFVVTVFARLKSVKERGSVTLNPETEIQKDDLIQWMFGDQDILIAEIRGGTRETHDDDGRFRGRLKLDETGSLTIERMRNEHTGHYKLQTSNSRGPTIKRFKVIVACSEYTYGSVKEKTNVTLPSDTYIVNDEVKWFFSDQILATGKNRDITKTKYCEKRFKDRLELNHQTGDLTIKNTRPSDSGVYRLQVLSLGIERNFSVAVNRSHYEGNKEDQPEPVILCESNTTALNQMRKAGNTVSVMEGHPVTLETDAEIQRDDLIVWRFGNRGFLIAEIRGGIISKYDDVPDGNFGDGLELDEKTGSLIIKNTRTTDTGEYKLQIKSNSGVPTYKTFSVTVSESEYVDVNQLETDSEYVDVNQPEAGNRGNDSAVEMPPVNEEDRDVGNEEGMSLLVMR